MRNDQAMLKFILNKKAYIRNTNSKKNITSLKTKKYHYPGSQSLNTIKIDYPKISLITPSETSLPKTPFRYLAA
jgi:hypothetical protein